ncbi:MAG: CDP-alcohol phosphatidyltransferase family protein [Zhengella sp.]|uniref:CDP-alcohol phosphatidyltransferase family protein n=1 Tax=Zhengella sp. TaxID=2282762 RepID=UPI001E0D84F1|nr:CDP-alcohol phosphatidyltransferase family protein [Notoacmeibacter sp.]MCC0028035.1 CDP-alcohol phosphatidyltransferase family protein [Brucellaceae bacterium]
MTIPNIITVLRFLLVPFIINAMLEGEMMLALAGFVLAGISDGVDGFIARHFDQRSELGAYLDPLADKLLLVSVFVVLGFIGELPQWLVIGIVSRDAMIVGAVTLSAVMGHPVQVKPLFVSKANTLAQILLAIVALGEMAFAPGPEWLRSGLITVTALLTGASAAAYLFTWLQHMSGNGAREEDN